LNPKYQFPKQILLKDRTGLSPSYLVWKFDPKEVYHRQGNSHTTLEQDKLQFPCNVIPTIVIVFSSSLFNTCISKSCHVAYVASDITNLSSKLSDVGTAIFSGEEITSVGRVWEKSENRTGFQIGSHFESLRVSHWVMPFMKPGCRVSYNVRTGSLKPWSNMYFNFIETLAGY
jgi:hypothetical protein